MRRSDSAVAAPLGVVGLSTVWQAVGTVVIGQTITTGTSTLSTFLAFGAAAMICVVQAALTGSLSGMLQHLRDRNTLRLLFAMNVATAGVFVTFYVALAYLPATAVSVLEAGCAPVIVALVATRALRFRTKVAATVGPLAVVALSATIATHVLLLEGVGHVASVVGVTLGVLAGISGAAVVLLSQALQRRNVTAVQVNAARFHLAWVVSAGIYVISGAALPSPPSLATLLLLSVLLGALPLITLQYGLGKANPIAAELIMSALPALVFLTEAVVLRRLDIVTAALMAALLAVSAGSLVAEVRAAHRIQTGEIPSTTPAITVPKVQGES